MSMTFRENAFEISKGEPDLKHYLLQSIGAAALYGLVECEIFIQKKDLEEAENLLDDWDFEYSFGMDGLWIYWGD